MHNYIKRKRLLILLISVSITMSGFGQPKTKISLPKGGVERSFYGTIDFYITENQEVFSEDKRLLRYDDISNLIIMKNDIPLSERRVLLYADKNLSYSFIEKIKEEIAQVEKVLFLMTDSIAGTKKGYSIVLNSHLNRHKNIKTILTLEQEIKNQEFNESVLPPPFPPPNMWYHDFEDIIYSGKKEAIKKVLKEYSYDIIRVLPNKVLEHKEVAISSEQLKRIIKDNDILFLKFDDKSLYGDYIYAIQEIKKHQIKLKKEKENRAYLVDISLKLEKLLIGLI